MRIPTLLTLALLIITVCLVPTKALPGNKGNGKGGGGGTNCDYGDAENVDPCNPPSHGRRSSTSINDCRPLNTDLEAIMPQTIQWYQTQNDANVKKWEGDYYNPDDQVHTDLMFALYKDGKIEIESLLKNGYFPYKEAVIQVVGKDEKVDKNTPGFWIETKESSTCSHQAKVNFDDAQSLLLSIHTI